MDIVLEDLEEREKEEQELNTIILLEFLSYLVHAFGFLYYVLFPHNVLIS